MKAKASRRIQELHDQLVQRDGEIAELRLQLDEARRELAESRGATTDLSRQLAHTAVNEVSPGRDAE